MKKSKYIFLILCFVYVVMGLLYPSDILHIGDNLLFGLSGSALLISTSDVVGKISNYLCIANTYYADIQTTIDFLDSKIQGDKSTYLFNLRNVQENYKLLQKRKYIFFHPHDYPKRFLIKALNCISLVLFVIGISAFIIIPFIAPNLTVTIITPIMTMFAFAAMALGLFLDEINIQKQEDINLLLNEKHILIQAAYSDFRPYFESHMYYRNDLLAFKEMITQNESNK